jgi:predicted HAD superfamily Cof-like phosphohydrolase
MNAIIEGCGISAAQSQVADFHSKFGHPSPSSPTPLDAEQAAFRSDVVLEEAMELAHALHNFRANDLESMAEISKECVGLIYVTLGTAVSMGVDLGPIFHEIHQKNMLKQPASSPPDPTLKPIKPDGWKPLDAMPLIRAQMND